MRQLWIYLSFFSLLICHFCCIADLPVILEVKTKTITIHGRTKQVYEIKQPDGTWGYWGHTGKRF